MCTSVGTAMRKATDALLNADLRAREEVISEDLRVDDLRTKPRNVPSRCSPAGPGGTDLRVVVSTIHAAGDLERNGRPCAARARASRRRHPGQRGCPDEIKPYFAEMGKVGCELAHKAARVILAPMWRWPRRSSPTTTPWTICTGTCSP